MGIKRCISKDFKMSTKVCRRDADEEEICGTDYLWFGLKRHGSTVQDGLVCSALFWFGWRRVELTVRLI